jgi:hypothetical protein
MSNNPKQSWAEWSDENSPAIEAAQAAPAEPCSEPTGQARALAVAPGSAAAIAAGCNCPIYDNAHGKGWLCSGLYIMRDDCPIHGYKNGEQSQPDGEHARHYPQPNTKT